MSFRDHRGAPLCAPNLTRRRFVQGLATGGIMTGLGLTTAPVLAGKSRGVGSQTLRGTDFRLDIGQEPVNFTGSPAAATAINGSIPAPVLRWREGDEMTLRVSNRLPVSSSIHWHGIILPERMDGVPGISPARATSGTSA